MICDHCGYSTADPHALTRGDAGNIISALLLAIEFRRSLIASERPADRRRDWHPDTRTMIEEWEADVKIFRDLRKRLAESEAAR